MTHRSHRIGGLAGLAIAACAAPAIAQESTPPPQPAPAPAQQPAIITLPGANRFDLQPSDPDAARPTPAPPPAASPAPEPSASSTSARTPARAAPAPGPSPTPAASRSPAATPTPAASETPVAVAPTPVPQATPAMTAPPTPAATPPAEPAVAPASTGWLWALLGAGGTALVGWLLLRRPRRPARRPAARREPAAAPPAPAAVPPRASPPAAPPPVAPLDPIAYEFRPLALDVMESGAVLEYELFVVNQGAKPLEGVRIALAMMSANPRQDELIESFHIAPPVLPAVDSIELLPGQPGRLPGKLALESDKIHVVETGARAMFVPLVMIDVRYRSGLSIRGHGADFMVGTAAQGTGQGQGGRLGPIWLDRGRRRVEGLGATRYVRKSATQAAE